MKRVGIIGAGRFGMQLAKSLSESGVEVLLLDRDDSLVQTASSIVTSAMQGDATSFDLLNDADFGSCDLVVVAIGSNIEASMLAVVHCKELGVPKVIAKAASEIHGKILTKLGVDEVIYPDQASARHLAHRLSSNSGFDLLEISGGYSIAEIKVPECCREKTLAQADLRNKTGVSVLCVRRLDENPKKGRALMVPGPNDQIHPDDMLIVLGTQKQIDDLSGEN